MKGLFVGLKLKKKLILKYSINENMEQDNNNINKLLYYYDNELYDEFIFFLDNNKININIRNDKGVTPLIYFICEYSSIKYIKALLRHPNIKDDIDINIKDGNGNTCLHYSCVNNLSKLCKLLLSHPNINPNVQNNDGSTPLHMCTNIFKKNSTKCLKLLLEHPKINPNILNKAGETCLHRSCRNKNIRYCRILSMCGKINPNIKNKNSVSPLHFACRLDSFKICELLLRNEKTEKNVINNQGLKPIDLTEKEKIRKLFK